VVGSEGTEVSPPVLEGAGTEVSVALGTAVRGAVVVVAVGAVDEVRAGVVERGVVVAVGAVVVVVVWVAGAGGVPLRSAVRTRMR
jgi:hypothetical protein